MNKKLLNHYKKHIIPLHGNIFKFIYARTNDFHLSEDIAQDTMEIAYKKLEQLRDLSATKSWIMKIAYNELKLHYISRNKIPIFDDSWEDNSTLENLINAEIDIAKQFESKCDNEVLYKSLLLLPSHYSDLLIMHYLNEFSIIEISEITGINYNTIKSRIYRGLNKLKDIYTNLYEEK
ncbi:MAG: RNA polymerase sigma factor [Anaerovoracaceae bacterium]